MSNSKSVYSSLKWIKDVSKRFARVDRNGRSAVASILATLGIAFGVMTLIVVMSVMNGFQMSFIDSIMEISSYHILLNDVPEEERMNVMDYCDSSKNILSISEFYEAQTLMTGSRGREEAAIIRAVNPEIYNTDRGFRRELQIVDGDFNFSEPNSIVLGTSLARKLGVTVGSTVNLFVLSGGNDVSLFSTDRLFKVTGVFTCGYSEIKGSFAFINLEDGVKHLGNEAKKIYGLKLKRSNDDVRVILDLNKKFPEIKSVSWREYNKTFFGALRIEKNILMLMVAFIFIVVGVNIYNGMRRLVFERKAEIAILSAMGARNSEIKAIFIMRGFITGVIGAFAGVILGLLISVNTEFVFNSASKVLYYSQYLITAIFSPQTLAFVQENSSYDIYAEIPARVFFSEVFMISLFGVFAPLFASWAASKNVLKMTVSEVLHDE